MDTFIHFLIFCGKNCSKKCLSALAWELKVVFFNTYTCPVEPVIASASPNFLK